MTESLDRNLEFILSRPGHKGIDFFQFEGRSMPNSNGHWKITVFLIDWGNPRGRHQHLIGEGDFQVDGSLLVIRKWFQEIVKKYPTLSEPVDMFIDPY